MMRRMRTAAVLLASRLLPARVPALLLAALVLPALAGCVSEAETEALRRPFLDAADAAGALARREFGPDRVGRRLSHLADDAGRLFVIEARGLRKAARRGEQLAGGEAERLGGLPGPAAQLLQDEAQRLAELPATPLVRELDPERAAGRLRHAVDRLEPVVGLDRTPLGEIDDPEHRTDPDDQRPPRSTLARLLRRLWH